MLRLGLRLTLDGGREAAARLIITAVAVALDVGLLLTTLASIDALRAQNARAAWLNTGSGRRHTPGRATRIAGPWLTMAGSRAMARRAGRPAVLTAGRRLEDSPRAAFRAVSGLILALFATCVAVGVITTSVDSQRPSSGTVASDTLVDHFYAVTAGRTVTSVASFPGAALQRLRSVRGVRGMAVIYAGPGARSRRRHRAPGGFGFTGLVSCAQLTGTRALGRCAAGAGVASIRVDLAVTKTPMAASTWPAVAVPASRLTSLPVQAVVVGTDGSAAAIERARTILETAAPYVGSAATIGEGDPAVGRAIGELLHMTEVVIAASLVIAGCSLAVSVAGGLADRRRPFSLLRLIGVPGLPCARPGPTST